MSWSQHLRSAQEFLKVGDEVDAVILTLDREERKMSLGMKQLLPDPWSNIRDKYQVNSKHKATVRNFTNFGIFVEIEEGVDGLIHISDLSWSKKIKHPAEFTKIGDEIEVDVPDEGKELHALIHVVVENQLAMGVDPVLATLSKLTRQGLKRHEAIHAIGAVLSDDIFDLLQSNKETWHKNRYRKRLDKLTAKRWRKGQW